MTEAEIFRMPPVSRQWEIGAYEELWADGKQSFAKLARLYRQSGAGSPSGLVEEPVALERAREAEAILGPIGAGAVVAGTSDFPEEAVEANPGVRLLYYRGDPDLLRAPVRISVIGSRAASPEGVRRARRIARLIAGQGWVVFSGLAKGIDTAAHRAAIAAGGKTVAVIGTPINKAYPRENTGLQEEIAREHLVVSQVPVIRGSAHTGDDRFFFPQRNITMSALTHATVIVEAGDRSGTLIGGEAAIRQGRTLFILDSCFRAGHEWPERLAERGAVRLSDFGQMLGRFPGAEAEAVSPG